MELVVSNNFTELSPNDMYTIDAGGFLVLLGGAWVLYELGYAVGKAIAHATN